jgi:hypothetical protein
MSEEIIEINKDNINTYYKQVNDAVDNYLDGWKVKPSNLKKFLKPKSKGLKRFIENNKLTNVKGIERIIKDVVEDRHSMEVDGVLTYENFNKINESSRIIVSLYEDILSVVEKPKVPIKYEKVIADKYNVSLGHVDEFDLNKHQYTVDVHGDRFDVFILSEEDLSPIRQRIIEIIQREQSEVNLLIGSSDTELTISELLDLNKLENKITKEKTLNILDDLLVDREDYDSYDLFKGFYIWER